MKILFLTHEFFPEMITGTERFTLNLAKKMKARGHKVEVLAYRHAEPVRAKRIGNFLISKYQYDGIPVIGLHYLKIPSDWWLRLDETEESSELSDHLFDKAGYDVVHVTHTMRTGFLAHALVRKKIPYVVTFTDFFLICHRFQLLDVKKRFCDGPDGGRACERKCAPKMASGYMRERYGLGKNIIDHAAALVSPSRSMAGTIAREFPGRKIEIIPHGIEKARTVPEKRLGPADPLTFGYMGMLAAHKGVDLLIRAFRKIKNPIARLKIYGPIPRRRYGIQIVKESIRDRRIQVLGPYAHSRVWDIFKGIDVLCFPSVWNETYGIIVEEALAAKVPPLVSDLGAPKERVRHGVNGLVVPARNERALRKTMQSILDEPEMLNRIRKKMNGYAKLEDEASRYERLYLSLVRRRRESAG